MRFIVTRAGVCIEAPREPWERGAVPVIAGEEVVTVTLPDAVRLAIEDAGVVAFNALRVRLAPFGLHPHDIAVPTYQRVLYQHEVRL